MTIFKRCTISSDLRSVPNKLTDPIVPLLTTEYYYYYCYYYCYLDGCTVFSRQGIIIIIIITITITVI